MKSLFYFSLFNHLVPCSPSFLELRIGCLVVDFYNGKWAHIGANGKFNAGPIPREEQGKRIL